MKRLLQAYRCRDVAGARVRLRSWYREPLGQMLLQQERQLLGETQSGLFGYHLLQLGVVCERELLHGSRIGHRLVMAEDDGLDEVRDVNLYGSARHLPLASGSVDVVLMPHLLEFETEPHQVLREVERVLLPEGHLLLLGFNPWSLFGLRRLLFGWRGEAPWSGHFYTTSRLKDWLSLLGFDTVQQHYYFHRPPLQHSAMMMRLSFLERLGRRLWAPFGGGYLLVARKRVATLTPIRPRWRAARRLISVGVTESSVRKENHE